MISPLGAVLGHGEQQADVAVIGSSIAGTLAAIRAKALGLRVVILGNAPDSGELGDIAEVPPTFLNSEPVPGSTFSELAREHICEEGMAVRVVRVPHTDRMRIELLHGATLTVGQVVYAPFGTEKGLSSLPFAERFLGLGVSLCTSSDAGYYAGRPIAVFGCAQRAAEQALIAARAGAVPTIYCAEKHFHAPGFDRLLDQSAITVVENAEIISLHAAPSGSMRGLSLVNPGGTWTEREASALFLAQGLNCNWSIFDGGVEAMPDNRVIMAGLASGLSYWDYAAHIRDVPRVVDAICNVRSKNSGQQ